MHKYYQIGAIVLLMLIFLAGCGSDNGKCDISDASGNTGTTPGNTTTCTPGDVVACYPGPGGTVNVGACMAGSSTCDSQGEPGSCVGAILPSSEICDGVDNDCDGAVDDNCI